MNKKEIVSLVNVALKNKGLTQNYVESEEVFNTVIETIRAELIAGKTVTLYEFGTFSSPLKKFRDPNTGKSIERFSLKFNPSRFIKDKLNEKIK